MCSAKSSVAAAAACALNPAIVMRALQNRVSPDTETVFDDAFWVRKKPLFRLCCCSLVAIQACLCCQKGVLIVLA